MPDTAGLDGALGSYPGAPFAAATIASAVDSIRDDVGWHIAPVRTETLLLDSDGGRLLVLPTLRLVAVTSVRDVTDPDSPVDLDDWRKTRSGMLYRRSGWPCGFETIEVTIQHGFTSWPESLIPVVAERCQFAATNATIRQELAGSESLLMASRPDTAQIDRRLRRYLVNRGA